MNNAASDIPSSRQAGSHDLVVPALALLAWSGVLLQLWLSLSRNKSLAEGMLIYLSFFTVLTNIFVTLTLSLPLLAPQSRLGRFFASGQTMACAATSIALVALAYHFLLSHVWNPQGLQWLADVLLHYLTPASYCAYWLFAAPKRNLPWWSPLTWCLYPIAYFAYLLLRGAVLGSYPYYFIDVATLGYARSLLNACALLLGFVLVGWLFLALVTMIGRYRAQ
ncbi:Pr6Pr family membrane protein [Oxalobacteraceae bacterium]|nr:Pr6Pr family membrane protein [Oxalobacteraceae bacterium]